MVADEKWLQTLRRENSASVRGVIHYSQHLCVIKLYIAVKTDNVAGLCPTPTPLFVNTKSAFRVLCVLHHTVSMSRQEHTHLVVLTYDSFTSLPGEASRRQFCFAFSLHLFL